MNIFTPATNEGRGRRIKSPLATLPTALLRHLARLADREVIEELCEQVSRLL